MEIFKPGLRANPDATFKRVSRKRRPSKIRSTIHIILTIIAFRGSPFSRSPVSGSPGLRVSGSPGLRVSGSPGLLLCQGSGQEIDAHGRNWLALMRMRSPLHINSTHLFVIFNRFFDLRSSLHLWFVTIRLRLSSWHDITEWTRPVLPFQNFPSVTNGNGLARGYFSKFERSWNIRVSIKSFQFCAKAAKNASTFR